MRGMIAGTNGGEAAMRTEHPDAAGWPSPHEMVVHMKVLANDGTSFRVTIEEDASDLDYWIDTDKYPIPLDG